MSAIHPNTPVPPEDTAEAAATAATAATAGSTMSDTLSAHKGKLAIGVAATLGLMVFYNWREKRLAKSDPEEYARLQRLKAGVRAGEAQVDQEGPVGRNTSSQAPEKQPGKASGYGDDR